MDSAVALVETYLRLNGYFTVTEFPVVELPEAGEYRTATDLDILAFRFPAARRVVPGEGESERAVFLPDAALGAPSDQVDMIVGEVKESTAEFNPAGMRKEILGAVLARFGCCPPPEATRLVRSLLAEGRAKTTHGHDVRLVAFGGKFGGHAPYLRIPLAHVVRFVSDYVRQHWALLRHVQAKDPTLGFLILLEKLGSASHARGAREEPDATDEGSRNEQEREQGDEEGRFQSVEGAEKEAHGTAIGESSAGDR